MSMDQPDFQPEDHLTVQSPLPPARPHRRRRRSRARHLSASPVIARCRYVLRRRDGRDGPLDLRVRAPEMIDGEFWCAIEIDWPNHPVIRWVVGGDSLQALVLALQAAGEALNDSPWHRQGRLRCPDQDGGYGLPVDPRERHRLVGDDRDMV
jgi:hypothetical protein